MIIFFFVFLLFVNKGLPTNKLYFVQKKAWTAYALHLSSRIIVLWCVCERADIAGNLDM